MFKWVKKIFSGLVNPEDYATILNNCLKNYIQMTLPDAGCGMDLLPLFVSF